MSGVRKLIPLLDRVLVQKITAPVKSSGGVLLPESAATKVMGREGKAAGLSDSASQRLRLPSAPLQQWRSAPVRVSQWAALGDVSSRGGALTHLTLLCISSSSSSSSSHVSSSVTSRNAPDLGLESLPSDGCG